MLFKFYENRKRKRKQKTKEKRKKFFRMRTGKMGTNRCETKRKSKHETKHIFCQTIEKRMK